MNVIVRRRSPQPVALCVGLWVLVASLAACTPSESRGAARILNYRLVDGATIVIVDTCNGDPEVTALDETDATVTVEVTSTRRNPGDACQDDVVLELAVPLGDRTLIDASTEAEVEHIEG